MPVFNVYGLNMIEKNWVKDHKFIWKRENTNSKHSDCVDMGEDLVDVGVDLNRNFNADFGSVDQILKY